MIVLVLLALFTTIYFLLFAIRVLRWLGFVQQKEYRLDRLQAFLFSPEGKQELYKLLPAQHELSRRGLKRPKITLRVLLVAAFALLVVATVLVAGILLWINTIWLLAVWLVLVYMAVPILIFVAVVPTVLLVKLRVWWQLYRARRLLLKHTPLVIGIGGSYGKTSTKFLIAELLKQKNSIFVTPHSYNTAYSVATSIVAGYTGQDVAIIEYGAYKIGEIKYLTDWLPPTTAVITGLTEQHLELFGTLDSSVLAESELVGAIPEKGKVYFNAEDKGAEHIVMVGSQGKQLTPIPYKIGTDIADLQVGTHGKLSFNYQGQRVHTELVGKHYGPNIAGAVAVAQDHDLRAKEIHQALASFVPNENYVRSYQKKSGVWLLDDGGTSNPVGFRAVIDIARHFPEERKVLITPGIVDLGEESEKIHRELAELSSEVFDDVLYVGIDGQVEFQEIMTEKLITNREQIREVLGKLEAGDLLVVEGKMPSWIEELV